MKLTISDLSTPHNPTWCPGCGDFGIWASIKNAIVQLELDPENTVIVYGIGCSGNMCNTINTYGFHGLHGRALPVAEGIKTANHKLNVITVVGDGDQYGEGMNHLVHACRGNHNITCIVHDNEVYGLTTGQVSPTGQQGHVGKSTPEGVIETPVNPLGVAISSGASFIARSFAGDPVHLTDMIKQAINHNGFALIDVLQQCPSFNKHSTHEFFQSRVYKMEGNDPTDKQDAFSRIWEWGEKIPLGVFYKSPRPSYQDSLPQLKDKPLVRDEVKVRSVSRFMGEYR